MKKNLLLVHGWATDKMVWENNVTAFEAAGYKVISIDLPGHGGDEHWNEPTLEPALREINRALAGATGPVIGIGWSLGAQALLYDASINPQRYAGLVLAGATPCFCETEDFPYGQPKALVRTMISEMKKNSELTLKRFYELNFTPDELKTNEGAKRFIKRFKFPGPIECTPTAPPAPTVPPPPWAAKKPAPKAPAWESELPSGGDSGTWNGESDLPSSGDSSSWGTTPSRDEPPAPMRGTPVTGPWQAPEGTPQKRPGVPQETVPPVEELPPGCYPSFNYDEITAALEALYRTDLRGNLPSIKCPVLVAHGTEDPICPVEAGTFLSENIAGARITLFEGAGHALFVTMPERFNKTVMEFAGRL